MNLLLLCAASFIIRCTENHIFFFQTSWKDSLSKNSCPGIWSFLHYRERWYFFFPKIWSYPLDEKWKVIFVKKNTWKYDIFFKCFEKIVFSKNLRWNMIFLVLSGKMVFFPRKHIFFWTENERRPFSRNTQKHDIFCRTFFRYKNVLERIPVFFCTFVETFIGVFICCSSAKKTRRLNT